MALPLVTCGESKWSFVTRLGIIPVTSPQPRGIIIPIVSQIAPHFHRPCIALMVNAIKQAKSNALHTNPGHAMFNVF